MATTNINFKVKNGLDAVGDISTSGILKSNSSSGIEGGQIDLIKPASSTTLNTGVTIDVYGDKLRFFENGGTNRGYYIDISTGSASVGTNLVGGGGSYTAPILAGTTLTSGATISTLSGTLTADQFSASNNGNGTNFKVGDDVWIGDINIANTMSIKGQQSSTNGFIRFGGDSNSLGYDGTKLTYGGTFTLTGALNLAAGTTSLSPLTFQSGTNLTSVTSGAQEYDGTVFYQTSNTNPGRALATQQYYYASSADYGPDFTISGAVKSMLGGATTGISVAAGTTYEYEFYTTVQHQYITNTGVTGTYAITSSTVSGSPTVAVTHQVDYGSNTTNFTTATTLSTVRTTSSVTFSATISSGSRYNFLRAKGIIRVTGTGVAKIYPGLSTSQVGASDNTWTVQAGTVFKLTPIGNGTATTIGTWA